jgi:hypothetical protein
MKGVAGLLLGAVVLALVGVALLGAGLFERQMAQAQRDLATLNYDAPETAYDQAERYFEYGSRLPWIGNGPLNDVRAKKAAVHYWQHRYALVVPTQADPVNSVAPDNVALQLVVANAVYRTGQAQARDKQEILQALNESMGSYLTVLKNAPRNEDAAYNFEYLVRLRDEFDKGKRKVMVSSDESDQSSPHGAPGSPPPGTKTSNFRVHIPLDSKEQEQEKTGDEAGKAGAKQRKG